MTRLRCFFLLATLCSAWLTTSQDLWAQPSRVWLEYTATPDSGVFRRFKTLFYRKLGVTAPTPASSLDELLAAIRREIGGDRTLFVMTDVNTIAATTKAQGWNFLRATGLEPIAPRIWGQSIYVFARAGSTPAAGVDAYVYWNGPRETPVEFQAGGVLARLGYARARIVPVRQVKNLVDALNDTRIANPVVVIYDPEPSSVIGNLIRGVTTKVQMLPLARIDEDLFANTGGVISILEDYETQQFYPALDTSGKVIKSPQVVVSNSLSTVAGALPLLLTNARSRKTLDALNASLGNTLQQTISDTYLLALFEYGESRCNPGNREATQQFRLALLNHYLSNRHDPYALIGLLGHIGFADPKQLDLFLEIAQQAHQLSGRDAADVIAWLQKQTEKSTTTHRRALKLQENMRAIYAGHGQQKAYLDAQEQLRRASANLDVEQRCKDLTGVRNSLATLAAISLKPACGLPQPTRGMWSGVDFEPFFYLTVIDTIMSESKCQ